MSVSRLNTPQLSEIFLDPQVRLLDLRASAEFNGWKLKDEPRGGHIPGAANFRLAWLKLLQKEQAQALLVSKGVYPDKSVVVCGDSAGEALEMAQALAGLGYENLLTYPHGIREWAANAKLPMEKLHNYEQLVYPGWIAARTGKPETGGGPIFLFEVGSNILPGYLDGHIPGAIYLDLNQLENPPLWNVISTDELERNLAAHGISQDDTVVLYSREAFAAARAALILMYAGVRDVRLLDGGIQSWSSAGYELERTPNPPAPAEGFGTELPAHPEYIIDRAQVSELLLDPQGRLVCVRSLPEFEGQTSGYDYIVPRGRIAGSVWGGSIGSDQFVNPDHNWRDLFEIEAYWKEKGIRRDQKVSFYCGTGWRASEAFFSAYLLGWRNISVYDGGWLEWSAQADAQIEVG